MVGGVGVNDVANGVRGVRRLGKAAQDEFEFVFIGCDITNREDALHVGLHGAALDRDMAAVQVQAPLGNGAKFHAEAEEGEEVLRIQRA